MDNPTSMKQLAMNPSFNAAETALVSLRYIAHASVVAVVVLYINCKPAKLAYCKASVDIRESSSQDFIS